MAVSSSPTVSLISARAPGSTVTTVRIGAGTASGVGRRDSTSGALGPISTRSVIARTGLGTHMHVGFSVPFQNPFDARSDAEVYHHELGFALQAEMWGFDSIWTVEHHFTDYTMCPDPLQLLTYLAGQTRRIQLGTGVIVLPWHDPMRLAEQITLLDNLSGGRVLLGIGRGIAKVEYEGFRVPMDTARQRFVEYAQVVLQRPRGRLPGARRRVRAAAPPRPAAARPSTPSGAGPTRPRSRPTPCRSWPSWESACW